jgi:3-hydroxyisobutyrate dehydrogenase-like beta-hydroxyacid dehydrogenase
VNLKAVGLLSPGDMGHVVGEVLIKNGMPVLTCLKERSERTRLLARKAGIGSLPDYDVLLQKTDLILSILVPAVAEEVAVKIAEIVKERNVDIVYVDCNAISPNTGRRIGEIMSDSGVRFVSASIIGPPPKRSGTTRFYVSGPNVKDFEELVNFGLDVRNIGFDVELAKGIKMVYGALTKGFSAISTELLMAARKMGLYEVLVEEFKLSQVEFYGRMKRSVPIMPSKSRRWVGEMEEIAETFRSLNMTPKIYQGAAEMYRLVGGTSLADETPENMDRSRTLTQVISMLVDDVKDQFLPKSRGM